MKIVDRELKGETWINSKAKRREDVLFATGLLAPALPLIAISGGLIFAENRKTPIFKQERLGKNTEPITIFKIRTMPRTDYDDPSMGYADTRATRAGKVVRKSTMDEAPQLLNIIGGSMSLVGPTRPLQAVEFEMMRDFLSNSEYRDFMLAYSSAKPGLFDLFGRISRNFIPQTEEYNRKRAELAIYYHEHASKNLDKKIRRSFVTPGIKDQTVS